MSSFARATHLAVALALAVLTGWAHGESPVLSPLLSQDNSRLAILPDESIPAPTATHIAGDHHLSISEAESLAVARHPALREAEGLLQAARGNWVQVGLRPNPEIGYSAQEIGDEGAAGQQGGYFSQEFVTADKLGLSRAAAAQEVAAAEQRYARARLQVITSVRMYYYEALAAERAVVLAGQLDEIARQSVSMSELRLKALEGSRAALLQSQIESESAAMLQEQSVNRREAAWRRLSSLTGMEGEPTRPLEDTLLRPLPELDWQSARERVLSGSPELAALRFEVERARWAVARARAGRVPNMQVQAGVARDYATEDTIASVQVSVPIPVFDRNQGAITEACGELAAAQAALEQRELALEQRLAAALRDYATARQRVNRYTGTILPAARQSLDLITRAYEHGEQDYLQLLSIQQTYTEKNLAYLQDLELAWKKWAEIDGLLVGPLADAAD